MKFKYKMMLSVILLLLTFSIYICFNYQEVMQKIKKVGDDESLVLAMDELSINFLTGNIINYQESGYTKEFSITNTSDDDIYYNVGIINVVNTVNSGINYEIVSDNGGREVSKRSFPSDDKELITKAVIAPGVTQRYKLIISGNNISSKDILEAKLYVSSDGKDELGNQFANAILKNNQVKDYLTEPGKEIAMENEGLIKETDDYGDTYYFRGNVDNNYVSFANYKWRIVRITGDNKVKLVLDEEVIDLVKPYNDGEPDPNGVLSDMALFKNAKAKVILETWYEKNLLSNDKLIESVNICAENSTEEEQNSLSYFDGYARIYNDDKPSFKNTGACISSKIGLLSIDEVIFAGGSKNGVNKSFYLYNSSFVNSFYTITPYSLNENTSLVSMFSVNNGKIGYMGIKNSGFLRPTIVINDNVKVNGMGTKENPYVLS